REIDIAVAVGIGRGEAGWRPRTEEEVAEREDRVGQIDTPVPVRVGAKESRLDGRAADERLDSLLGEDHERVLIESAAEERHVIDRADEPFDVVPPIADVENA